MAKAPYYGRTKTPVPAPHTARKKAAQSSTGRSHSNVPLSRWSAPGAKATPVFTTTIPATFTAPDYLWRLWALRGDAGPVLMEEVETVTWDDSSAVLTGSINFRSSDWAKSLGLREGHKIRAEFSEDGHNFTPIWTMRLVQPNGDLVSKSRTGNLASDLNRLAQSNDDFVYAKGKGHKGGWRVDEVIRDICDQYGIEVAYLPVMKTLITNWHLIDQHPIDVIHSALIREKKHTGRKYAVSMDWRERLWVTPFRRPTSLMEIGPQIIAATGSVTHDPRFATAVTVRTSYGVKVKLDRAGHRTPVYKKLAVDVSSPQGISLYGYIHRNVYSPDANSNADAEKEGKLFLTAVAKPKRSFTVTLPGLAGIKRLDAFKVILPSEGIVQIVYVSEARHTLSASSGYTVETVLDFDDPFVDDKTLTILSKLSDVAVARRRKSPVGAKASAGKGTKTSQAHSKKRGGSFGSTFTPAKPSVTRK